MCIVLQGDVEMARWMRRGWREAERRGHEVVKRAGLTEKVIANKFSRRILFSVSN